jgi:phosphate transport system substrate-binding protein
MDVSELTVVIWHLNQEEMMMTTNFSPNILKRVKKIAGLCCIPGILLLLVACGNGTDKKKPVQREDGYHGNIRISVDESFKPVIDSQIKVYQASFPEAHIVAEYKTEAECLKDLSNDSVRMVIVTRGLTRDEAQGLSQKLSFEPTFGLLAFDGVALIMNKEAKDSVFTVADIREMLSGNTSYKYKIVMDGINATSTVRYAIDSILKGQPLSKNVEAAKSTPGVIEYVSKDPNAIGMIGVSWVGNQDDSEQLSFNSKIKIASVRCDQCTGEPYTKPYQANLATGRYPFRRGLYYILKENYGGLGNGFMNFMVFERGQLIFKRAYLLPARMSFDVREAAISE